ncbi:MAG: ATP-binding cassette domain-containing protein [Elusimicrobia bacterium]|nr:ATP-binding cassette domain-containing protein [Elusimicrobiota bacterium]
MNKRYPEGHFSSAGNYSEFLKNREALFNVQAAREDSMRNIVRRETEWLRRGPKARTTKQKARIDRAGELMGELKELEYRNAQTRSAAIDFTASERKTKKLVSLTRVVKSLGGKKLFGPLDLVLGPGDKWGLLGGNGSGKSTLLKLLAGTLAPDAGRIERVEGLTVVTFDQHRETLDMAMPLRRALCESGEFVYYKDKPVHVVGWAERFLFGKEQLDAPLGRLSGGEQSRVMIARLMLRPADVLLLDEPTNDLDLNSLEVLETSLMDFAGALVLVTHDRYLLDRVSQRILALDGRGNARVFADLDQWEERMAADEIDLTPPSLPLAPTVPPAALSAAEARELRGLEEKSKSPRRKHRKPGRRFGPGHRHRRPGTDGAPKDRGRAGKKDGGSLPTVARAGNEGGEKRRGIKFSGKTRFRCYNGAIDGGGPMSGITFIRPRLAGLSGKGPLNQNLKTLHRAVRERFPYVHRIAVALYDAQTHRINTYLASGDEGKPLAHYQSTLPEAVSLKKVLRERRIRVVDDLNAFEGSHREHTQRIREMGYRSSCTFPLEARGKVRGFLFFNSRKRAAFKKRDIPVLEAYALLATEVATRHLRSACVMLAAIKTAGDLMHFRDPETGYHLDRMARFSRVIAQELGRAGYRDLTDERVQAIEVFAPMHDVGKLAIPDHILKKAAALTPKEKRIMRTHAPLGRRIIDAILKNFGMESFERADALRQIAESHHETLDGKGTPGDSRASASPSRRGSLRWRTCSTR